MNRLRAALVLAIASLTMATQAMASECASDVAGLRRLAGEPVFSLRWIEVGMDDGRPLSLTIGERDGALHVRFDKSQGGVWAQGTASICAAGAHLELLFKPGQLRPGPGAHWLLQKALGTGGRFTMARTADGELRVSSVVWSGRFTPVLPGE